MKLKLTIWLIALSCPMFAQEISPTPSSLFEGIDTKYLNFETQLKQLDEANGGDGPQLTRNLGQTARIRAIRFSPDNKFIITADAHRMIKFWDASSGRFLRAQQAPYQINSLSISPDGKTYATGGGASPESGEYLITLWETETGDKIKEFHGHTAAINDLEIQAIGKIMASVGADRKLRIWDIENGIQKESHRLDFEATAVRFNPLGSWILLSGNASHIEVWNLLNGAVFRKLSKDPGIIPSIDLSPNGRNVVAGIGSFMGKWDFVLGTFLGGMESNGPLKSGQPSAHQYPTNRVAYNPYGNYVYSSSEKKIVIWDEPTMRPLVNMTGHQSKIVNFALSADGYFLVSCAEDGSFILWDAITGRQRWSSKSYFNTNNEVFVTEDGRGIVTSNDGANRHYWNLETLAKGSKSLVVETAESAREYTLDWKNNALKFMTSTGSEITLDMGEPISTAVADDERDKVYVKLPDRLVVLQTTDGSFAEFPALQPISQLAAHPNGKLLFGAGDGISVWHLESQSLVATIHDIEGKDDYFITTPDGYHMSTKKGLEQVHFVENLDFYTFDQFDLQFNRPDIIYERLGLVTPETVAAYKKAWEKRVRKMGFDPADFEGGRAFEAPMLQLIDVEPFWEVNRPEYTFDMVASDQSCQLDRVIVHVDGVPYFGAEGYKINREDSCRFSGAIEISMAAGINQIQVSVMNQKGVESVIEKLEVTYSPAQPVIPNLHVIVIGVSHFQQSDYDLTYADKDALDIADQFRKAKGFGQINVYALTNEQATADQVLALRETLEQTRVDDEVVVFVASHGLLDDNFDYYIAMHDTSFENPKKGGLPYDQLESLLDGIPARHKLMLLDACHSGEVDKEETSVTASVKTVINGAVKFRGFKSIETKAAGVGLASSFELMKELFADLRRNNGAVVISSASGKEFAFESAEWQNGVFTYALLEGLRSGHADLNHDQSITVSEVRDYVGRRVVELTDGKQNPTSRTENLDSDFMVWK